MIFPNYKVSWTPGLFGSKGPLHVIWQVSFGCWVTWSNSSWQEYYNSVFFFNFTKLQFLNDKSYTKKKLFGTWQFGKIDVLVNFIIQKFAFENTLFTVMIDMSLHWYFQYHSLSTEFVNDPLSYKETIDFYFDFWMIIGTTGHSDVSGTFFCRP